MRYALATSRDSVDTLYRTDDMASAVDLAEKILDDVDRIAGRIRFVGVAADVSAIRSGHRDGEFRAVTREIRDLARAALGLSQRIRETVGTLRGDTDTVQDSIGAMASKDMAGVLTSNAAVEDLLARTRELQRDVAASVEKLRARGEAARTAIDPCVRSLQFADITTQALDRSLRTVETQERVGPAVVELLLLEDGSVPERLCALAGDLAGDGAGTGYAERERASSDEGGGIELF